MIDCICTFCDELAGNSNAYFYQLADYLGYPYDDRVLASTENFVAIPGLGALTEAYVLILPREHYLAIGGLPESLLNEYLEFKAQIWSMLDERFGEVISFEHGPAGPSLRAGCCVEHAHLHLLAPCSLKIQDLLSSYFNLVAANEWKTIQAFHRGGLPYVYCQDNQQNGFAAVTPRQMPSQFLRRLIANTLGIAEWDWHHFPKLEHVADLYKSFLEPPVSQAGLNTRSKA